MISSGKPPFDPKVFLSKVNGGLEAAFTTMVERQVGALIVMPDPLFFARRVQLVARHPVMRCQLFIRPGNLPRAVA